jgi:hypothetical protein
MHLTSRDLRASDSLAPSPCFSIIPQFFYEYSENLNSLEQAFIAQPILPLYKPSKIDNSPVSWN